MEMDPGMTFEPRGHARRVCVWRSCLRITFNFQPGPRHVGVDGLQEGEELLGVGALGRHGPIHHPGGNLQRGEQRCGAMNVLRSRGSSSPPCPGLERQRRLSPVQRLDLGLLIESQSLSPSPEGGDRPTTSISFASNFAIGGQLECVDLVRFQPSGRPHPLHLRRRHPHPRGHGPARPMGLPTGGECIVNSTISSILSCGIVIYGRARPERSPASPSPPRRTVPPCPHRRRLHPYLRGDPHIRHTIGRQQQRLRPLNLPMRRGPATATRLATLLVDQSSRRGAAQRRGAGDGSARIRPCETRRPSTPNGWSPRCRCPIRESSAAGGRPALFPDYPAVSATFLATEPIPRSVLEETAAVRQPCANCPPRRRRIPRRPGRPILPPGVPDPGSRR